MIERSATVVLFFAAFLTGCNSASQQQVNDFLSSELALSAIDPKAWNVTSKTKWWMCRDKPPREKFSTGDVSIAMGIPNLLRFDRTQEKCNLKIVEVLPMEDSRQVYRRDDCEISFPPKPDEELLIYVRYSKRNARTVERCLYRFALWAIGKGNLGDLPDEKLFVPREETIWKGFDYLPGDLLKVDISD